LFAKHGLTPQIWLTAPSPAGADQAARVTAAVAQLRPAAERTARAGCRLGLYNHGGWGGEPENLVAVCTALHAAGFPHVGIVYNLHHGHGHIADFAACLAALKPHLLCLNLNGMTEGTKILQLGRGQHDLAILRAVRDSGYAGPIGIIGHTNDDVEARLRDNLDGLDWLLPQLAGRAPGPPPQYRTP
jgi:sugar phosphate isomerase/epimerase